MLRKYLGKLSTSKNDNITWRSHEPSRIEAFSDSVFAFAISLSVISLEMPHTFSDFIKAMHGLVSFVICFAALCGFWFKQYKFFRRYGLHDDITIFLNCALLLMILLFIYPLKFLSGGSVALLLPQEEILIVKLYTAGIAILALLFGLMYTNAYLKRVELNLTIPEEFETITYVINNWGQFFAISIAFIIFHFWGDKNNFVNNLPALFTALAITLVFNTIKKRRKKQFTKRFGDIPETEPQLGAE